MRVWTLLGGIFLAVVAVDTRYRVGGMFYAEPTLNFT